MNKNSKKAKVFVSYSRRDALFADQLIAALESYDYELIIDRRDTSGGENWRPRIGELILKADTIIFILSPDSATSEICIWEINEARRLGKRLIPIICRPLGEVPCPQELSEINFIYFYAEPSVPNSGFGAGLKALHAALAVDIDWYREQSRLSEIVERWIKK